MPVEIYTSLEQPDSASLMVGAVMYRCTVFLDRTANAVRSVIEVEQPSGKTVTLQRSTVRSVTAPDLPDCPRVLASGSTFVVHWLEGERTMRPDLHRARLDMSTYGSTSTWTHVGMIAVHTSWLYDAQPLLDNADGDFVVTYGSSPFGVITVLLHSAAAGWAWIDYHWSISTGITPATRVLACYGHEGDGDVVVAYQSTATANRLFATRLNVSDGGGAVSDEVYPNLGLSDFTQCRMCRYGAALVAVVSECVPSPFTSGPPPRLVYGRIDSSSITQDGNEHATWNLRMLSGPWAYAGARIDGAQPNVLVAAGYQHVDSFDDWGQSLAFVVNLDAGLWGNTALTVRSRPMVNINTELMDARVGGASPAGSSPANTATGRRANHVCSPSGAHVVGPAIKSRTLSLLSFARLGRISAGLLQPPLLPLAATVSNYRIHLEDAWLRHRDATDPPPPSANVRFAYPQSQQQIITIGGQLVISGGTPQLYDRHAVVELGFAWAPEILAADVVAGGLSPGGVYQYVAVYEWRDARGRLHRSRPSTPRTVTTVLNNAVNLDIGTMTLSLRDNTTRYPDAQSIAVAVYRTEAGGTTFYRLHSAGSAAAGFEPQDIPYNDPTFWRIEITDGFVVTDALLVAQELLPYQFLGGAWTPLPPFAPPASGPIATWKNRVWLAPIGDYRLWYSGEILPEPFGSIPTPPEFNPSLVFRIDHLDVVTAMAAMDEMLVVFCRGSIYAIAGEAADQTGQGATLDIQVLSQVVGCIEPKSVVLTPKGLFFQAENGYTLLTRTLELDYVSAGFAVDASIRTGGNIRAASHLPDRHEIRLVTNGAVAGEPLVLAYNYLFGLWSEHPLPLGEADSWLSATAGGCAWYGAAAGALHVVVQQGALLVERQPGDANEYADEGALGLQAVPINVQTGWISTSGIQGFQRTREVQVQMYKPQASAVSVDVYYDVTGAHDDSVFDTALFSSPAPALARRRTSRQKYPIRVGIRESGTVPLTQNLAIVGFSLVVGVLGGHRRVRL